MFGIGAQELILILVVALLVFGPKRLPELARTMGKGLAEFRRASSDLRHSLQGELDPDSERKTPGPHDSREDDRPAMAGDTGPVASVGEGREKTEDPPAEQDEGEGRPSEAKA